MVQIFPLLLILLGVFSLYESKSPRMYLFNYKLTLDNKVITNGQVIPKCDINTKTNPCDSHPELQFTFNKDIVRPYIQFKILDVQKSMFYIDQTILMCLLAENDGLGLLMKPIWDSVMRHLDFKIECPLPAGIHLMKDFPIADLTLVRTILPKNRPLWFNLNVRIRENKVLKTIFNYSLTSIIYPQ